MVRSDRHSNGRPIRRGGSHLSARVEFGERESGHLSASAHTSRGRKRDGIPGPGLHGAECGVAELLALHGDRPRRAGRVLPHPLRDFDVSRDHGDRRVRRPVGRFPDRAVFWLHRRSNRQGTRPRDGLSVRVSWAASRGPHCRASRQRGREHRACCNRHLYPPILPLDAEPRLVGPGGAVRRGRSRAGCETRADHLALHRIERPRCDPCDFLSQRGRCGPDRGRIELPRPRRRSADCGLGTRPVRRLEPD